MKTYINNIKGTDYLYAYDSIYIAKGKTIQKNKSLGRVDTLVDVTRKKQDFLKFLIDQEIKLRSSYWEKHITNPKFKKFISIEKIESFRTQLYRAKQDMGPVATSAMETAFLVDFIYNSNKIEGSKIPRKNVEEQIRGGKSQNDEIGNTLKALYYVNNKFSFTVSKIKELHSILLAHEPSKLGLRRERVIVANSEVSDWKNIKEELQNLTKWFNESKKYMYPPELAFTFYYKFERIHPFIDGNGRTGRLIMNQILKSHRYHPTIIWNKRRRAHLTAFENYQKGHAEQYYKFMVDQFAKTHEIYLTKIQKAFDLEKQLDYFLQPSEYNLN